MTFVRLAEQSTYEPAGHHGVINRLLAGRMLGNDQVSVWHGALAPGGGSDTHEHETAVQIYVGLTGTSVVTVDGKAFELGPLTAVTIPAGTPHRIHNHEPEEAGLLVISAPALR